MLRPIITQVRSPLARRGEKTSGKGGNGGGDDMRAERVSLYKGCHLQPRIPIPPPTITNTPQTTPSAIHHRVYALSLYFSLFFEIYILRSLYAPRSRKADSMIALWAFNAMAFLCNWMLVSSSVLKDDNSLRIFKESPNEFEYMVKRHDANDRKEDTESKERRSTMGSSFIRFGRGQSAFNTIDNSAFDNEIDPKVSRHPRWKSPDVVIRFGRSDFKTTNSEQPKRGKNDLNFIRFGRNIQIVPADLDLSAVCSALMSNGAVSDAGLHPDVTRLFRLCNNLNKITGEISLDTLETDSNHRE